MKRITPIFLIFFLLTLACQKQAENTIESASPAVATALAEKMELDKAIIQTPPSIISASATLDIHFREPVMPAHFSHVVLDESPFTFHPDINGHAEWVSPQLLRFTPEATLPPGTDYTAVLSGKTAFGSQKNADDFHFSFKTAQQEVIAYSGEFTAQADAKNHVILQGTLTFAQAVEIDKIREALSLKGPKGRIALTLSRGESERKLSFASTGIPRTHRGQNFTLSLPKAYTAGKEKWQRELHLTAQGVFRVITHVDMTPPQARKLSYGFRFSDPVRREADLSGYVDIAPAVDYTVRAQGKYLFVEGRFLPGQSYTARLARGLPSAFGDKTAEDYEARFSFNNIKPQIQWLSDGVYLPTDNDFKLQFKSVNVRRLRVNVTEILPQNIGFFLQNNGLQDRSRIDANAYSAFEYEDLGRVGVSIYNQVHEITLEKNQWIKTGLNLGKLFQEKNASLFVVSLRFNRDDLCGRPVNNRNQIQEGDLYFEGDNYYNSPTGYGYYYAKGTLNKLLIASDIGLTVKEAGKERHVYAANVHTAGPVSGLKLSLFTYQNKNVETVTTDAQGMAIFSEKGSYILGRHHSGIALLKMNHPAWQINNFDVSGASSGASGNNAFIYLDRGVHRPGDTIHLAALCRTGNAPPPEKQPIKLTVRNPMGQIVLETQQPAGANGHVYFAIPTDRQDPTGSWNATLSYGGSQFYRALHVETVKPNRLKIDVNVPAKIVSSPAVITGKITTKYLFGTPASGLHAAMTVQLQGRPFYVGAFAEFQFNAPLKSYASRYETLMDQPLDAQGTAAFNYAVPDAHRAPGLLQAQINTTVYEKGGGFTEHLSSVEISPYTAYAGIKNVFDRGWTRTDEDIALPVIAVNAKGEAVKGQRLTVRLYVNRSHWWYDYDDNNRRDFRRMSTTQLLSESHYTSGLKPILHRFRAEDRGRHYIEVIDENSGHETGLFFYASPWGDAALTEEKDRNTLQISANRNVYHIGDEAVLSFDAPEKGLALFTLEQGSAILQQRWVQLQSPKTTIKIPVTQQMLPNCYASISLIQPHNQNSNDVPMRVYGIKNLPVEDAHTRLPLRFTAPDVLKPKEDFTIAVTSDARQTASFTVAVVDEGLLDLTRFRTPSPWQHYFQKMGLNIRTLDNYDQIMGLLLPDMDKYFTIGGGLMADAMGKRTDTGKAKRFKPVVLYQAPVSIQPGATEEISFTMPNYVGSVRVMLVGASGHSYADLEKTVAVKQPLMLLPTVPRAVRPGDSFALPVSVFAMDSSVTDAKISLSLSSNLKAEGEHSQQIHFDKPGEKDLNFSVRVGRRIGADTLTVEARSGDAFADNTVHLPVSSPNPFYTEITDTTITQNQSVTLTPRKFGLEGTQKARIAFTRMPDIQINKRISDLIRYPFGCVEQLVSTALPQLFLDDLTDLSAWEKQAVTDHINAVIERLNHYKTEGGFSLWPVSTDHHGKANDWCSSYVGHLLIEARAQGYHVPPSLFNHWLNSARKSAKTINAANHRYQAYRLFLLAMAEKPHMGAMNLLRENYLTKLDPLSRKLLAAAYTLSGQNAVGEEMDRATPTKIPVYREMAGTLGSSLRDRALMAYLTVKMNDTKTAARLVQILGADFTPYGWYSTQETAMTLLALGSYVRAHDFTGGSVKFHMHIEGQGTQKMTLDGYQTVVELEKAWDKKITVTTDHNNPLFVTMMVEGVPVESRVQTEHHGLMLTRHFYDDDGRPITIDQCAQGRPFWVVYTVQSQHSEALENLALSSLFPAGWEVVNLRLTGQQPPAWVEAMQLSDYDFMDLRDDRVNWFFDLQANRPHRYAVKINPSFKGDFILPPVSVEGMYSPEFYARIKAGRVTVQ